MKEITAIIVEDEENAVQALRQKLDYFCPNVKVVACCFTAEEGKKAIMTYQPDVVFLDVLLPRMNGFEMLNSLKRINFYIVFTSGHAEYAIQCFIYSSALHFLSKPIDPDDLQEAVRRVEKQKHSSSLERILVATKETMLLVNIEDILYCRSESNYTWFYFQHRPEVRAAKTLKEVEEQLSGNGFFRVHLQYLVNLKAIDEVLKGCDYVLMKDKRKVDVARNRKAELLRLLGWF